MTNKGYKKEGETMRAFLAIKHHDDVRNRDFIEEITAQFKKINIDIFVFVRDVEHYEPWVGTPRELMQSAFAEIEKSDIVIAEISEQSIGVGIEVCYAFTRGIPVYVLAKKGTRVNSTIKGICKDVLVYENLEDLQKFKFKGAT